MRCKFIISWSWQVIRLVNRWQLTESRSNWCRCCHRERGCQQCYRRPRTAPTRNITGECWECLVYCLVARVSQLLLMCPRVINLVRSDATVRERSEVFACMFVAQLFAPVLHCCCKCENICLFLKYKLCEHMLFQLHFAIDFNFITIAVYIYYKLKHVTIRWWYIYISPWQWKGVDTSTSAAIYPPLLSMNPAKKP